MHPSRYPDASRARLEDALAARILPGRFLYDSPVQAARWLAYHRAFSPSRTDDDVERMYDDAFAGAIVGWEGSPFTLVSLGSGGGRKDARLLERARGRAAYVPVDTSPALVVESMLTAGPHASRADPRVVDLEAELDATDFGDDATPRLFTAFGMVPNFELEAFGPRLAQWLRPRDRVLISFNLSPGTYTAAHERILRQYDNPESRAWLWGALRELGLSTRDAELRIGTRCLAADESVWRIEARADLRRDLTLPLPGRAFAMSDGESLRVLISNRFTVEAADAHLRRWGFEAEAHGVSMSNEEGVWRCRRAST